VKEIALTFGEQAQWK